MMQKKLNNLPEAVWENALFCLWRRKSEGGKIKKVPFTVDGKPARSNDRRCFSSFEAAIKVAEDYDGIGLGIFDGLSAIDIDNCVDEAGNLSPMAQDIVDTMQSYTELSPSGHGIRILFRSTGHYKKEKYYIMRHDIGLEVYVAGATSKYVTVTGDRIGSYDLSTCDKALSTVCERYMLRPTPANATKTTGAVTAAATSGLSDAEIIDKATKARNGAKFNALMAGDISGFASANEADYALCAILAFWVQGDETQIDRIFRSSGLMRPKWDRPQSGSTYGRITIRKAIKNVPAFYEPPAKPIKPRSKIRKWLEDNNAERRYGINDIETSRLFAHCYLKELVYVPARKKWFYYNGQVWKVDQGAIFAQQKLELLVSEMQQYALSVGKRDYCAYCYSLLDFRKRKQIIEDAQNVHTIDFDQFDATPWLLNCNNGTLDLRTMTLRPHNATDLITRIADVDYDPEADCQRFEQFIDEVMCGDNDKAAFLQRALGYALSGDTRYECCFFIYGQSTRNGKGTLMESVLGVLGDYGKAVNPETIAVKKFHNGSSPSDDVARLAGLRLANISEPGYGMTINSALLKTLTGNDTITARFLYENSFSFKPTFKLYINTNHLPNITDPTVLASGRVHVITFDRHFNEAEQDRTLKQQFSAPEARSAILNWLLRGHKELMIRGLDVPTSVANATKQYAADSDIFAQFAADCLVADPASEVRTQAVYVRYRRWCDDSGEVPVSLRQLRPDLEKIGKIVKKRPRAGGEKTSMLMGFMIVD